MFPPPPQAIPVLRVGLTGSLAGGKSSVGRLFERWGAERIDADELAREAVEPGSPGLARIREEWGERALAPDGSLDREAMRGLVFEDPPARRRLERVVHEEVHRLRSARHRAAEEEGVRIIVDEIPLLYEVWLEDEFDIVIVVDADPDLRRARAMQARGWSAREFDAIESAQMPAAEKRERADIVIRNDGDEAALEREARAVWQTLLARAPGRDGDDGGGEPGGAPVDGDEDAV